MTVEKAHEMPALPLQRICQLLGLSRSWLYAGLDSCLQDQSREEERVRLRDAVEDVCADFPGYGYRRVTHHLSREGWQVNHKRILRVMREESLLCHLKRRWVPTTDSEHGLRIYPNLLLDLEVDALDQVWMADITYIRLRQRFLYLAVILDCLSRRVVGWELSRRIDARLACAALQMALETRCPEIHHSDRGVQYACRGYVDMLKAAGVEISMSRKGRPTDNAKAESFFKTLKQEEVYLNDYEDETDARASIGRFLEDVYNTKRLHSALDYRPPAEFEQALAESDNQS